MRNIDQLLIDSNKTNEIAAMREILAEAFEHVRVAKARQAFAEARLKKAVDQIAKQRVSIENLEATLWKK